MDPASTSISPGASDGGARLERCLLDISDDAQVAAFLHAWNSAWPEFATSPAELRLETETGGPVRRWVVRDSHSGEPVGAVDVQRITWNADDAPPIAMVALSPGRATVASYRHLLEPCCTFAREHGCDVLRVLAWDRETVLRGWLASLDGWSAQEREIDVGLRLDSPAAAALGAPVVPEGYGLTTLAEHPDLERDLHECLGSVLPDVPGDEVLVLQPFEHWSAWQHSDMCPAGATAIALAPDGTVAGYAGLELPQLLAGQAWHGFTAVRREHRGRGLAIALKLATIAWARREGLTLLRTENEERNAPMRHINRKLGYEPIAFREMLRGPVASLGA